MERRSLPYRIRVTEVPGRAAAPSPWQSHPPTTKHTALSSLRATTRTMKALYPASHHIPNLPEPLLALKIARHSRCSSCPSGGCPGLRPPPDLDVVLDSDIYDDESRSAPYLSICVCGHRVRDHGADPTVIEDNEFYRRARVAGRLDELSEMRDYKTLPGGPVA